MCYNIDGLLNKLDDLDFLCFINTLDFICLCETFVTSLEELPRNIFSNFNIFFSPAIKLTGYGRPSGGVIVLIKSSFSLNFARVDTTFDNTVVLKLQTEQNVMQRDLLIVCTYIPPYGSPYYVHRSPDEKNGIHLFEHFLHNLTEEYVYSQVIICGDLNARLSNVQPVLENDVDKYVNPDFNSILLDADTPTYDYIRTSKDIQTNMFGKSLINLCSVFEFIIVNGISTCPESHMFTNITVHGSSVVDYFLVSHDLMNQHVKMCILDRTESSHMAIQLTIPLNVNVVNINYDMPNVNNYVTKYTWDAHKLSTFTDAVSHVTTVVKLDECAVLLENDFENSVCTFNDIVLNAATCMKKTFKESSTPHKPKCSWFDDECKIKKKEIRTLLNRHKRSDTDDSKLRFISARRDYKQLLKLKRKRFCKHKENKLVTSCFNNSPSFWSNLKEICHKPETRNTINIELLQNHFKGLFQTSRVIAPICSECFEYSPIINDAYNNVIINENITPAEIDNVFRSIKTNKAVGSDMVSNEMLTSSANVILPYLTRLFQYLFLNGVFPECWSISTIVPIYKKGNNSLCSNYRPISLTSLVSKLYTGILNNRIKQYLDYNDILCNEQGGYREGYAPIDHIFTLYSCIHRQFVKDRKLYVAFVDYKCCFDSVTRDGLFNVLRKIGIDGKLLHAIKAVYVNVQARVRNNNQLSDLFSCESGLKQGCLCSPSLFLIFINELSIALNRDGKHGIQLLPGSEVIFHLLFADDALLISDTVTGLQNQLNVMNQQSKRLGLEVNLDKTKIVVFRKGGFLSRFEKWSYNDDPLQVVNCYKYLGVDFTTMLSFNNLTGAFVSKAKQAIHEILSSLKKIDCYNLDVFTKLFDSKVKPILLYGSELWGCSQFDQIEKVHLFALKRFLNVSLHCSNNMVYAETGRYPMHICSQIRAVKYWFKLTKLSNDKIINNAYSSLLKLDSNGKSNWVTDIRQLLITHGFEYAWLFQSVGCEKTFLFNLRHTLIDCFKAGWHGKMVNSETYNFYSSFKSVITKELYLCQPYLPKCFRDTLIKFRLSVSQINCHRFKFDTNKDNLYCPFCRVLRETESHVLFICPVYSDLRKAYLPAHTLQALFTRQELKFSLARFLFYVFKLRNTLITHIN